MANMCLSPENYRSANQQIIKSTFRLLLKKLEVYIINIVKAMGKKQAHVSRSLFLADTRQFM